MQLSSAITLQISQAKPRNPREGGREEGWEERREGGRERGEGGREGGREEYNRVQ